MAPVHNTFTSPQPETGLNRFLFSFVSAAPLALLRVATGILMIFWSITLLNDLDPLLTWLRVAPQGEIGWWQVWPGANLPVVSTMAWLLAVFSVLLAAGCWTKWAAWSTFLLTLFLQRYNPTAFNGGDFILRGVLLLGLALGPSGAYLSVDAYRRDRGFRWTAPLISVWSLRFIQLHISLGYVLTVLLKLRGNTWLDGTAVWYALNLEDLIRFRLPNWVTTPPVGALLSWGTLVLELGVGVGVWIRRLRPWVLLGGVLLHLAIALTFEIGFFSYVMIVSYLAWSPPVADVRRLVRRLFKSQGRHLSSPLPSVP